MCSSVSSNFGFAGRCGIAAAVNVGDGFGAAGFGGGGGSVSAARTASFHAGVSGCRGGGGAGGACVGARAVLPEGSNIQIPVESSCLATATSSSAVTITS